MNRCRALPLFVSVLIVVIASSIANAQTWISAVNFTTTTNTATISWVTAVPSDSIVDYGLTTSYGSTSSAATRVTSHSVTISGLQAGTTYHFRVRSCDSDGVVVAGLDYSFTTQQSVSVTVSPTSATIASGGTQQFTATVSNSTNTTVTWSATAGTISASGLFTAPTVTTDTTVTVKATSAADTSKSASATITVKAPAPVPALTVSPMSLSFSATQGGTNPAPATLSIANSGGGTLSFTASSDQAWLAVSPSSGTAPQTVQTTASISSLAAGVYTAHITITAAGATPAVVTVTLTVGAPVSSTFTMFGTLTPTKADAGADASAELGMKFTTDTAGQVTALRFYKSAANTGSHVGNLWSSTGTLLATVTFANETASGWQQQALPTPVSLTANTTYVVSYHAGSGHYAYDTGYFNNTCDKSPLHAPVNGSAYVYGSTSKFPTTTYQASNYWVDLVLSTSVSTPPPSAPVLAVSTTSLNFAATRGGSNPAASSVTNTGTGTLTFTAASDASWLAVTPASGTAPLTLQITPNISGLAAGTYTGHITVTATGVSGSPKTITATLTVSAPVVQHNVGLSWGASTSTNVVSYNLYRSSVTGGPYSLVTSTITGLSYTDTTVQSAVTYYYVATAVDSSGKESSYSPEAVVAVP